MKSWRGLALAFVLSFGTAGLGGAVTDLGPWYQALQQPPWKPPDWAFGPIWNVGRRRQALVLWAVNGACNVGWSFLFFKLQRPDWALMEWVLLWSSIAALMMALRRDSNLAAWLLLPYLLWVSVAGLLNHAVIALNGPFPRVLP
jgi:benzodiazapine receptor